MSMEEQSFGGYYAIIPAPVRYDKDLDPLAKLLYGEISSLCNKHGHCWASNKYFAETEGVSERTVRRLISQLEEKGYIRSEMVTSATGTERRIYAGLFPEPVEEDAGDRGGADKFVRGGVAKSVRGGVDKFGRTPNKVEYYNVNNNNPPTPPTGGTAEKEPPERPKRTISMPVHKPAWFEKLWVLYPNHKGRQAACKAWDKLKPDRELAQAIGNAICLQKRSVDWARDDGQYIPHFSSWLNGRRWEDEVRLQDPDLEGGWADDPEVMG